MQSESKEAPIGVLLTSAFFFLVGILFFSFINLWNDSFPTFLFTILGFIFILIGWGVLFLKPWSFYAAITMSALGIFILIFAAPIFIAIIIYITLRQSFFINTKKTQCAYDNLQSRGRVCPDCSKSIPFDSKVCPYCGKIFKDYF